MREILLKRNQLKSNSVELNSIKLDKNLNYEQSIKIHKQQKELYNKWKFYDKFIKAREEAKNEKNEFN